MLISNSHYKSSDIQAELRSGSFKSGQFDLALVCAACEGVAQTFVHVRAPATSPFERSSATGIFVRVFFEVRTFLPGLVYLAPPFKVASAGPGALPALVGHVLVLAYAVLNELR